MTALTDLALEKAQDVLRRKCSPLGLMASPEGYPHVWARDSVITGLGASLTPGHEACLRTSLHTLAGQQSELGAIPNNVSVATGRLDHTNAGSVRYALDAYLQGRLRGAEPCGESRRHEAPGWQAPQAGPQAYEQDEGGQLREEITALRRQLADAMERLAKLEK